MGMMTETALGLHSGFVSALKPLQSPVPLYFSGLPAVTGD